MGSQTIDDRIVTEGWLAVGRTSCNEGTHTMSQKQRRVRLTKMTLFAAFEPSSGLPDTLEVMLDTFATMLRDGTIALAVESEFDSTETDVEEETEHSDDLVNALLVWGEPSQTYAPPPNEDDRDQDVEDDDSEQESESSVQENVKAEAEAALAVGGKLLPGPVSLFRGKVRKPVSITLTPEHHAMVNAAMHRLGLSRADVIALLIEKYAPIVAPPTD